MFRGIIVGKHYLTTWERALVELFESAAVGDKDAVLARIDDRREECHRDADDQCTRAADDKEGQGTIDPRVPVGIASAYSHVDQWSNDGKDESTAAHERCIDLGKACDEGFRL